MINCDIRDIAIKDGQIYSTFWQDMHLLFKSSRSDLGCMKDSERDGRVENR